jgi:hypothetical protein
MAVCKKEFDVVENQTNPKQINNVLFLLKI